MNIAHLQQKSSHALPVRALRIHAWRLDPLVTTIFSAQLLFEQAFVLGPIIIRTAEQHLQAARFYPFGQTAQGVGKVGIGLCRTVIAINSVFGV